MHSTGSLPSDAPVEAGTEDGHTPAGAGKPVQPQLPTSAADSRLVMIETRFPLLIRWRNTILFLIVGGASFAIDAGLLLVLAGPAGLPTWLAATISFWSSVFANFFLNRMIFRDDRNARLLTHGVRYGILLGVNYGITLVFLEGAEALGFGLLIAKIVITALSAAWNYFLYSHWVFK